MAINSKDLYHALELMVQGMAGIFVTILIIMVIIWIVMKCTGKKVSSSETK